MRNVAQELDIPLSARVARALLRRLHDRILALADGSQLDLRIALAHPTHGIHEHVESFGAYEIPHEENLRKRVIHLALSRREFLDVNPTVNHVDALQRIVVMRGAELRGVVTRREDSIGVMDDHL